VLLSIKIRHHHKLEGKLQLPNYLSKSIKYIIILLHTLQLINFNILLDSLISLKDECDVLYRNDPSIISFYHLHALYLDIIYLKIFENCNFRKESNSQIISDFLK